VLHQEWSPPTIEDATFGNVRGAIAAARAGVATQLEGNVGMSAEQAETFAQSLLRDGGPPVRLRLDGIWLHVEPIEGPD
jgi:hypothetical protein